MSLLHHNLRARRIKKIDTRNSVVVCGHCRSIRKFGQWIQLSAEMYANLFLKYDVIHQTCKDCLERI